MRDQTLKEKRDSKIFDRYNDLFWGQLMREDLIYGILTEEFCLSRITLYGIILKKRKQNPDRKLIELNGVN